VEHCRDAQRVDRAVGLHGAPAGQLHLVPARAGHERVRARQLADRGIRLDQVDLDEPAKRILKPHVELRGPGRQDRARGCLASGGEMAQDSPVQLGDRCGQVLASLHRGREAGRRPLEEKLFDRGVHVLPRKCQAAQQESLVTSRVKAWAASLRPSPMVRYGAHVPASSLTVMPSLTA
jgi:hypothetical protein